MPLKVGEKWFYMARAGLQNLPDNLEVTRKTAVGGIEGYELAGDLGSSRLAWNQGRLITDQMAGAQLVPPLPILASKPEVSWRGWVKQGDRREPAKATISDAPAKLDIFGHQVETVVSTVDLKVSNRSVQLVTWFQPNVGIVRQEQRTDGRLDLMLEYLGG